ncbi:MAG: hypothetical protein AB7H88_04495 [Vicinamibacterales bacterium]
MSLPRLLAVALLASAPALAAQAPAAKTLTGYVVAVKGDTLTISNVPLAVPRSPEDAGGGGMAFVMRAPRDGEPSPAGGGEPSWVTEGTAAGEPAAAPRVMLMRPEGGGEELVLTDFAVRKGLFEAKDFPAGAAVAVTYTEADGRKTATRVEKPATPPGS